MYRQFLATETPSVVTWGKYKMGSRMYGIRLVENLPAYRCKTGRSTSMSSSGPLNLIFDRVAVTSPVCSYGQGFRTNAICLTIGQQDYDNSLVPPNS